MYGFFKTVTNNVYDGRATADIDLGNGMFVDITESEDGVKAEIAGDAHYNMPYLVCNVDETQPEEGVATVKIKVAAGHLLRLKQPTSGEFFCTSEISEDLPINIGVDYSISYGKISGNTGTGYSFRCTDIEVIDGVNVYTFRVL